MSASWQARCPWTETLCLMTHTALCRWAGLMKGAITVALVYYHFDPKGWSSNAHRATLISTTLIVVLFSIMILGALTKPLLDAMLGPQGAFS